MIIYSRFPSMIVDSDYTLVNHYTVHGRNLELIILSLNKITDTFDRISLNPFTPKGSPFDKC